MPTLTWDHLYAHHGVDILRSWVQQNNNKKYLYGACFVHAQRGRNVN